MNNFKYFFVLLFSLVFFTSCSSEDEGDTNPTGENHTYAIEVTSGFLDGFSLSGSVLNEEFMGLYVEDSQQNLVFLTQGLQGESGFIISGGVSIVNGQPLPLTNTINGFEGSSLLVSFDNNGVNYVFESLSGTCTVSNLNKFPTTNTTGIASYTYTFTGTFRQANTGGADEDAPLVEMSGTIDIKRAI